jgi:aminopeptidase N
MANRIFLKDYVAPQFTVDSIHLYFNLHEKNTFVTQTAKYKKLSESSLLLDGAQLKLITIELNGRKLELKKDFHFIGEVSKDDPSVLMNGQLEILNPPQEFELKITTEINPSANLSFDGLYLSKGTFCTQCEAQGFRKITFFMDRPDVMTKYSVDIEADEKNYPILLSNGDRLETKSIGNGRKLARWSDPHKKPSYLFALVAGDLGVIKDSFKTKSGRQVNLEVYASHGKQERCTFAMESLKKAMSWDEVTFGLEYDLNDFMIVAIDDFNMGAMENKGLNIFNSRLVLADSQTASDSDYHAIESVVAHEYFHNWTGNRITCQNWFYLSLKEGLTVYRDQEFSADMGSRSVQRIRDVDSLRSRQFAEDAGPNAHPVRPDSCLSVDNFYTATIYEKGSEVIRMMQRLVGRKGFRLGMDTYFAKYDGQAVRTDDFVNAIFDTNNISSTQFKLWYTQAGTPEVYVEENFDASLKKYTLTLKQNCRPTREANEKKPFHIPLFFGLIDQSGKEIFVQTSSSDTPINQSNYINQSATSSQVSINKDGVKFLNFTEAVQKFEFLNIEQKPFLSLNRDFTAPVQIIKTTTEDELIFLMHHDSDVFNKREATQQLFIKEIQKNIDIYNKNFPDLNLNQFYKLKQTPFESLIKTFSISEKFLSGMKSILLNPSLDNEVKSLMLQWPVADDLSLKQTVLHAPAIEFASHFVRFAIASFCYSEMVELYHQLNLKNIRDELKFAPERSLKNKILFYLVGLNKTEVDQLCLEQFQNNKTMTDQIAAVHTLNYHGSTLTKQAMSEFYSKWNNEALVLNKWFSSSALSASENTFKNVQALVKNEKFDIHNPNNVYSLLGSFTHNILHFHQINENSYEFLADQILTIDKNNPQVAARLCSGFNLIKKLPPILQDKAKLAVQRVLANSELSKNSRELLETCL